MNGVTVGNLPVVNGVRHCTLCWSKIDKANGFVLARDAIRLVDLPPSGVERRRLPRELCGLCAILFMTELRELMCA